MNLELLKPVLDYAAPILNIVLEPLIAALIIAIILGLATGGHLRYLGQLASLRRWELELAAFALQ